MKYILISLIIITYVVVIYFNIFGNILQLNMNNRVLKCEAFLQELYTKYA